MAAADSHARLVALHAPAPFFHDALRAGGRWPARVAAVHDGDTLQLTILFADTPIRLTCRMLGYDSPELNSKDIAEFQDARRATLVLREALGDGLVWAEFHGREKFGRMLVRVFTPDGRCVNDVVMQHAFNVLYAGGARPRRERSVTPVVQRGV